MKGITPAWAALALAAVGLLVAAWMFRFEPSNANPTIVWDRWAQKMCMAAVYGDGPALRCYGDPVR
ncbi:hypothetical protein LV28_25305 [Pandoraea pnomenusa]|uniref:Uncharacterized protein n=1 Tax=Pandoraea pnomenusa TaxID=93220 RepID=A0A378YYT5_9BURK|nr:hypothetical protein LV28_25305 [Pandoraea pnomenusa]SUA81963.1 Uncharacterised protein [Pandoraea pnomenusa]